MTPFVCVLCDLHPPNVGFGNTGTFNILVYTGTDTEVPTAWQEDDAHMISGTAEQVKLRTFSTSVHKVDALVAYRLGDD